MHRHTGCICSTFLHCVLSNGSSNGLPQRMHNHIGCICSTFLHCVFSNEPSKRLHEKIYNHTDCICVTFVHCAPSNVSSNCLSEMRHSHIGCICSTFLHCAFWNVSSNGLPEKRHSHIGCICLTFLQPHISPGLKYFNRKATKKLRATYIAWHLFCFPLLLTRSPLWNLGMFDHFGPLPTKLNVIWLKKVVPNVPFSYLGKVKKIGNFSH